MSVALAVAALAGCGGPGASPTQEPAVTPRPIISLAVEATRLRLDAALREAGFGLEESQAPARPPEPASFTSVVRATLGVPLATGPGPVLVTVYEFADPAAACAAAEKRAALVASGPGIVTHPPDSRFVIGVLGSTVSSMPGRWPTPPIRPSRTRSPPAGDSRDAWAGRPALRSPPRAEEPAPC